MLSVRAGTAADFEVVASLQREIQAAHAGAWPEYFLPPSPSTLTRETFDRWLADASRELLVAALGERVVGHAWLVVHERAETSIRPAMRAVEIDQICVTAPERGRGYGRRLLAAADERARARGAERVELSVYLFNREAISTYERHGFTPAWQRMTRRL